MTKATSSTRFARAKAAALAAEHGLFEEARRVYVALTARSGVRTRLHAGHRHHTIDKARSHAYGHDSALARVTLDVIDMANAGATAAELERVVLFLRSVIAVVSPAPRDLDQLDLAETRIDGVEDLMAMRRRVQGATVEDLLEEARTREALASVNTEQAQSLRAIARRGPTRHVAAMAVVGH